MGSKVPESLKESISNKITTAMRVCKLKLKGKVVELFYDPESYISWLDAKQKKWLSRKHDESIPKIAIFSCKQELIDIHVSPDNRVLISVFIQKKPFIKTYAFEVSPEDVETVKGISSLNARFWKENPWRLAVLVNPISGNKKSWSYFNEILGPALDIA